MKKLVKETPYVKLFHEEEHQLFTAQWLPSTENADDAIIKEQSLVTADVVEAYKPKIWVADLRFFFYTLSPEMQEWGDEVLTPRYQNAGLEKMAMLISLPEDNGFSIRNLALEQLTEEANVSEAWLIKFFEDEEKARKWLLE